MAKPKLENIEYGEVMRRGKNFYLIAINHLYVKESFKIINFPDVFRLGEFVSDFEKNIHLSNNSLFKRVINDKELTYTIRRVK